MMKLRRFMTDEEMKANYAHQYNHTAWPEHKIRVRETIRFISQLMTDKGLTTAADMSCGDGAVMRGLTLDRGITGDISITGIDVVDAVRAMEPVDLYICTETIEHVREPWTLLEEIAKKTRWIVLSTPLNEPASVGNWEHYWSFTEHDISSLLVQSGFHVPERYIVIHGENWTYAYQTWAAEVR